MSEISVSGNAGLGALLTVKQFAEKHGWITENGLRRLIFQRKKNGFNACMIRVGGGRKILIDEDLVLRWLKMWREEDILPPERRRSREKKPRLTARRQRR